MDELDKKIANLSKKKGLENAKRFMNLLARDQSFVNALETEAGKHVLTLLVDMAENKMAEILSIKPKSCTDCPLLTAKIELGTIVTLVSSITAKINQHSERSNEFNSL